MTWLNALLPVVTLIVGYFGTLLTEARRDARALDRAREERDVGAKAKRAEARDAFELDTLRRAYSCLSDLMRATMRHHLADLAAAHANNGTYGVGQVGDELSQTLMTANRAVREVTELVLDDKIRREVQSAHGQITEVSSHRGPTYIADDLVQAGVAKTTEAQRLIAERIRAIYNGASSR